ncbi:ATP-binding protein [Clostridium sp.]|uniref:ATP-binding protein n=1 Tax=Clostridium sp. TaxID=1506 RepID=UPI003D6D5198
MRDVKSNEAIIILKGEYESAVYKQQELDEYKNNPFIEALPNIFNEEDVVDKFTLVPQINKEDRIKASNIRYHIIKRAKNFVQPLPIHIILERRLSALIRRGYLARNPIDKTFLERLKILNELRVEVVNEKVINDRMSHIRSTADSLSVIGISGIGKTTAIERLLLMYPQVIKHEVYEGQNFSRTQIVWLKIDCPYDGSLATLCKSFFKAIDDLLDTRYLEKFGYTNRITSTMMLHMTTLASMYGIGVLVIDEIQHLLNAKNDMEGMLDFFVTLSNTVGIPTVLIGTSKAQQLFKGNFRQARRAGSEGSIMWDRMLKSSEEWKFFLETLWGFQCLQEETKLSKEIKEAFYDECQGITAVAVNLYILAQERALAQGKEKISVSIIRKTAKEDLYMIQPMIKAFRNNNILEIIKYEDISINLEDIAINYKSDMELNGRVREVFNERKKSIELMRRSTAENIIFELKSMDLFKNLDEVEIKIICEKAVNESSVSSEYSSLKMEALKKALEQEEKKKHNKDKIKKIETKKNRN